MKKENHTLQKIRDYITDPLLIPPLPLVDEPWHSHLVHDPRLCFLCCDTCVILDGRKGREGKVKIIIIVNALTL